MDLGGPVWHASTSMGPRRLQSWDELETVARAALDGVGDTKLGEWVEQGNQIFHLRRRLSVDEQDQHVGPVVDVRQTDEGAKRFAAMRRYLPANLTTIM